MRYKLTIYPPSIRKVPHHVLIYMELYVLEYGTFLYVVIIIHYLYTIVSVTSDPYLKVHSVHSGEWRNYFSCVQRIFYTASFFFFVVSTVCVSAKISFNFIISASPYD